MCDNGYPAGMTDAAEHDATAIINSMGNGVCGVGPNSCSRFACYKKTGVAMCNVSARSAPNLSV